MILVLLTLAGCHSIKGIGADIKHSGQMLEAAAAPGARKMDYSFLKREIGMVRDNQEFANNLGEATK